MLLERKPAFLVAVLLAIFVFPDSLKASSCSRSHGDCLWCQELPQQRLYLDGIENKEPEHLFLNGSFNLYGCLRSSSVCLAAVYHKSVASQGRNLLPEEVSDEYPSFATNSSGIVIGGSCSGGFFLLCVLLYFLYRLLTKNEVAPLPPPPPYPDCPCVISSC